MSFATRLRALLTFRRLKVGARVLLGGSNSGSVIAFIPGQNEALAAMVQLDQPLTAQGVTGSIVVLELRYAGAIWSRSGTVHVELCDFMPESKPWRERRQGKWIESQAAYTIV